MSVIDVINVLVVLMTIGTACVVIVTGHILYKVAQEEREEPMNVSFKTVKLFDCQDMPEDVRRKFFDVAEMGNDCVFEWPIGEFSIDGSKEVDEWLIAQGAGENEEVLVKHWW